MIPVGRKIDSAIPRALHAISGWLSCVYSTGFSLVSGDRPRHQRLQYDPL